MLLEAKPENGHEACGSLNESLSETTLAEVNGNFQYFLPDAQSTVRDIVDDAGAVVQSYEFDPHGVPMPGSGAGSVTSAKTYHGGLSVNDDMADAGLYLMGHRFWAPELGRFISRDPIGFRGGLNLFGTAFGNNPVTMVDPSGRYGEATVNGNNVHIVFPVEFYGPAATQLLANQFESDIESVWNNRQVGK